MTATSPTGVCVTPDTSRPGGFERRPPASLSCRPCSPALGPGPGPSVGQPVGAGRDAGSGWLAGSARHWPPGGDRRRRFGCGRDSCAVESIGYSLFLVGFLFQKPLSQLHRSTLLPFPPVATLIISVDWGLVYVKTKAKVKCAYVIPNDKHSL